MPRVSSSLILLSYLNKKNQQKQTKQRKKKKSMKLCKSQLYSELRGFKNIFTQKHMNTKNRARMKAYHSQTRCVKNAEKREGQTPWVKRCDSSVCAYDAS